jgi:Fe-S-cluster containining protein
MTMRDSLDNIIGVYFACVASEPFTYKGKTYEPKPLRVSPLILRGYTCPPMCAGCCPRFSLDYLPQDMEPWPKRLKLQPRFIKINDFEMPIYSDLQLENKDWHCKNVNKSDGRCMVHGRHPFSCDFELIRFLEFHDPDHPNALTQKLFGRGWALLRVDGERGARCDMLPVTDYTKSEVVRKLRRLQMWCDYFAVKNKVDAIVDWVRYDGVLKDPLVV